VIPASRFESLTPKRSNYEHRGKSNIKFGSDASGHNLSRGPQELVCAQSGTACAYFLVVFLVLPLVLLRSVCAAQTAAAQAGVIQTQETNDGGVVGELIECRRSEGVLTIKVRFRKNSDKAVNLTFIHWGAVGQDLPKFYVTAGNKKYFTLKDTDGTVLSSNSANAEANLGPGKTYLWWAKYPAPLAEVRRSIS